MENLTKQQVSAIRRLESSIKKVGMLGIKLCGMDNNIYYATSEAIEETPLCGADYCEVADAVQFMLNEGDCTGTIRTNGVYQDSGGW